MDIRCRTLLVCRGFRSATSRFRDGGGILIEDCRSAILSSCHFEGHGARNFGGALNVVGTASSSLQDCHFVHNSAANGGGAYYDKSLRYCMEGCTYRAVLKNNSVRTTAPLWEAG